MSISEEEIKNTIGKEYFPEMDCTQILGRIDFCVAKKLKDKKSDIFYIWAEAKKTI